MMNPRIALALFLFTAGSALAAPPELAPLFNGKDLSGWSAAEGAPFWRVEQGVLIGENDAKLTGNVLWTEKSYGNFVLETDVRWSGEIDSGVMLRKPELQMQIGISRSLKKDMTGSFYTGGKPAYPEAGQAKNADQLVKIGEWNRFRLEARGTTFTVWINGQKAVEYSEPKYAEPAKLGLQIHPGLKMKVEYRAMRLAELP